MERKSQETSNLYQVRIVEEELFLFKIGSRKFFGMAEHIQPAKAVEQRHSANKNKEKAGGKARAVPLLYLLVLEETARDLTGIDKTNQVNSDGDKVDNKNNFHFREPLSFLYYHYNIKKEKINTPLTYIRLEIQELLLGWVGEMDCIRHKCISNEFIMPDTEYTLNKIVNGDARESKRFCNDKKRITKIPIVNANVISFLFEVFDFFSNEYYTDIVKNHTKNLKHAKYIENNGKHKNLLFIFVIIIYHKKFQLSTSF